jgi:hypothetical protein
LFPIHITWRCLCLSSASSLPSKVPSGLTPVCNRTVVSETSFKVHAPSSYGDLHRYIFIMKLRDSIFDMRWEAKSPCRRCGCTKSDWTRTTGTDTSHEDLLEPLAKYLSKRNSFRTNAVPNSLFPG